MRVAGQESDDVPLTAVRARAVALVCLACVVSVALATVLSTPAFPVADHLGPTAASLIGFAVCGGWSWWYGHRAGEAAFIASVIVSLVAGLLSVVPSMQPGLVVAIETGCMVPALLAAAFAEQRRGVLLVVALNALATGWMARLRLPGDQLFIGLICDLGILLMCAGAVRALQEVAVVAWRQASRGEVTDPLTGLANRRGLERYGPRVWQGGDGGDRVALLVVDIDHFKQINDTRGHAAGDQVIQQLAEVLVASVRAGDVVVRLGGEEFLLLMTVTGPSDAAELAESVRARVEAQLGAVTVSIGVYDTVPDPHDELPNALLQALDRADQALYEAKRSGRNRVVSAAR